MKCVAGFSTWLHQDLNHQRCWLSKIYHKSIKLRLLTNLALHWVLVIENSKNTQPDFFVPQHSFSPIRRDDRSDDLSLRRLLLVNYWTGSASGLIITRVLILTVLRKNTQTCTHTQCELHTAPPPQQSSVSEKDLAEQRVPQPSLCGQDERVLVFKDLKLL